MCWIARIYKHDSRYDIMIDYENKNSFVLFNVKNYKELKEKVYWHTRISLVKHKDLHFMSDSGMKLAVINGANSKTKSCCVTVQEVRSGLFDWKKEIQAMREEYKHQ